MNNTQYYEETAKGYDELHREEQLNKLRIIKNELSKEKINKHKNILDIGGGTGLSSEIFENVTCLEPSKKMLEEGLKKRNFKAINDYAENTTKLFKENEFDTILCITSIHHFNNVKETLKGFKKITKKNADIIITLLKRSQKTPEIIKICEEIFELKKEINEDKDTILFLKNNK